MRGTLHGTQARGMLSNVVWMEGGAIRVTCGVCFVCAVCFILQEQDVLHVCSDLVGEW